MKIHQDNKLQIRALLLTMLNSGLISSKRTSELINYQTLRHPYFQEK